MQMHRIFKPSTNVIANLVLKCLHLKFYGVFDFRWKIAVNKLLCCRYIYIYPFQYFAWACQNEMNVHRYVQMKNCLVKA